MAKVLKTISVLCLLILTATGCIDDDRGTCPPEQLVRLVFHYTAEGGQNVVDKYIGTANIAVFDSKGNLVDALQVSKEQLLDPQGVLLPVKEAGEYSVVCWGNRGDNTEVTMGSSMETSTVQHPNYTNGTPVPTHDPLYYSLTSVTASQTEEVQGKTEFVCAYVGLDIYIKTPETTTRATATPVVEVHNLTPQYDFRMNPVNPFSQTYYPQTVFDTEKGLYAAHLNVLRFTDEENPTEIEIKDSGNGKTIYRMKLKEFMQAQEPPLSVAGNTEVRVPVLIDCSGLNVTVTLPQWGSEDITPW